MNCISILTRRLLLVISVLGLASLAVIARPPSTFHANSLSLGPIPDGALGGSQCGDFGDAREVMFLVTGISSPIRQVTVNLTINHSWVGDLKAVLLAPTLSDQRTIFSQTGESGTPTGCGDNSDLNGTYTFGDGTPTSPTWWEAAAAAGPTGVVTPGFYRASAPGGFVTGGNPTPITSIFTGLTPVQANGTWTIRISDGGQGDTGAVTAASITLTTAESQQHVVDMNGDGFTDFSVVRNIIGGPGGQTAWFTKNNNSAGTQTDVFGVVEDVPVPADFDGDNKTDVAVWRPGAAAFFYVLRSSTSTFQPIQWGKTGDNPRVVGDYDGDNKADAVVYRSGVSAGDQSFWHVQRSSDGAYFPIQWGQAGDFPAPGDYDGDNRTDAAVQRGIGGSGIFYVRLFNGSFTQTVFGASNDIVAPGDYDGDGKTDLAVVRNIGGVLNWFYDPSAFLGTQIVQVPFGASSTDSIAQGDYDGDGRTDPAVWRSSTTPGQSAFYFNRSSWGFGAYPWGHSGDKVPANYNSF